MDKFGTICCPIADRHGQVRAHIDIARALERSNGDDVPRVMREYVGGERVNHGGGVWAFACAESRLDTEAVVDERGSGAYLNFTHAGWTDDSNIKGRVVTPWLEDLKAVCERLVHEAEFGAVSHTFERGTGEERFHVQFQCSE